MRGGDPCPGCGANGLENMTPFRVKCPECGEEFGRTT